MRLPRGDAERTFQVAKRLRRRFLFADYEDENRRARWTSEPPRAPYEERRYDVRPDPAAVRSLLVFKPDEIGDAVHSLPAVAELRRAYPQARLFLLCQRLAEPIYARTGLFDEIVAIKPGSRRRRPWFDVAEALRGFSRAEFDVAVFLRTYPAYFPNFLEVPAAARVHPVDPGMRSDSVLRAHVSLWDEQRRHQALQLLEIAARLTGERYDVEDLVYPSFTWTEDDARAGELAFGAERPERYVVVHPFVKHETRRYPEAEWRRLIERLRERIGGTWVIVGGPDDPRLEGLPGVIQTQGRLSLGQTGHLIAGARAFLGILSGPAHWAAALGTPTVTIMSGHSLPVEWAPLGRTLVLRAPVPCAPCHQPTCPIYGLACLTALPAQRIAPDIERFMESVG
jgi:ADP-heptose:LPS heptosyltransferase